MFCFKLRKGFLSLSPLSPLSPSPFLPLPFSLSLSIFPSPLLLPPSFSLYSLFKVLLEYSRALSLFRVTRYLFPPNSSSLTLTHTHTLSCYLRHSRSCSNAFSCSYSLSFAFSITDTHSLRTSFQGTHPLSHSFSHTLTHTHGYTLMVVLLHTHTHTLSPSSPLYSNTHQRQTFSLFLGTIDPPPPTSNSFQLRRSSCNSFPTPPTRLSRPFAADAAASTFDFDGRSKSMCFFFKGARPKLGPRGRETGPLCLKRKKKNGSVFV